MGDTLTGFVTICELYIRPLADYKIREFADNVIKATVQGKSGIVEVWGGAHADEVWVIERGTKKETCITGNWCLVPFYVGKYGNSMCLEEALSKAFALAGVQTRMVM